MSGKLVAEEELQATITALGNEKNKVIGTIDGLDRQLGEVRNGFVGQGRNQFDVLAQEVQRRLNVEKVEVVRLELETKKVLDETIDLDVMQSQELKRVNDQIRNRKKMII
jgi:hypothetical protein